MGYAKYLITLKWNGFFHSLLAEIWFGSPNAKKNKLLNQMTLFSRSNYLGYIFRKIIFIILHEEFSRLKIKTLLKSHGCTSATQYEESLSVCKRAHIFEASKEMIMLWCKVCLSSNIAEAAHLGHPSSKFVKVTPWISKSRLTDNSSRYQWGTCFGKTISPELNIEKLCL